MKNSLSISRSMQIILLATLCVTARAVTKVKVSAFSPSGTVKKVRQVHVAFSDDVVPFGDTGALLEPFTIQCPEKGTPRWADTRNWIYDFAEDLDAGVQCEFKLKTGLKTSGGTEIESASFSFSTGGPAATHVTPREGTINEDQAFIVQMDGKAKTASILQNAYFLVPGIADRIGIRLIEGRDREEILKTSWEYKRLVLRKHKKNNRLNVEGISEASQEKEPYVIVIQAKQVFPAGANIQFIWGRGITSESGVATTDDQSYSYDVRPEFTATFSCERTSPDKGCIPLSHFRVEFSSPVEQKLAAKVLLKDSKGHEYKMTPFGTEESDARVVTRVTFPGPFPEKESFAISLAPKMVDDTGRPLSNAKSYPLAVRTEALPPLVKFAAHFGILESHAEPSLPVTLRSVEPVLTGTTMVPSPSQTGEKFDGKLLRLSGDKMIEVAGWLKRLKEREMNERQVSLLQGVSSAQLSSLSVPKPNGARAFEVVGIPLKKPGFYVVELKSPILGNELIGEGTPMYVAAGALVTNLSVHFKRGRENALAWVTTLDEAKPVADAIVSVRDCTGKSFAVGKTNENGVALFNKPLPPPRDEKCQSEHDYSAYNRGYWITAEKEDDFSFVHSSWDKGIEPWRFQVRTESSPGPNIAHAVLDRSLFRAGETVHMKHLIRRHTMKGFGQVPTKIHPTTLRITHTGTSERWDYPLKWDATGITESTWEIPKSARLGQYQLSYLVKKPKKAKVTPGEVSSGEAGENNALDSENTEAATDESTEIKDTTGLFATSWGTNEWFAGSFQVEEFRVPLMKGSISVVKDSRSTTQELINPKKVPLDLSVSFLAGGGAQGLPVDFKYQLTKNPGFNFPDFEDYTFASGAVPIPKDNENGEGNGEDEEATHANVEPVGQIKLNLDNTGGIRTEAGQLKTFDSPATLHTELSFRDPNGEISTVSQNFNVFPSSTLVGVKPDSWFSSLKNFKFYTAVVDLKGIAVPKAKVEITYYLRKTYSHRKRLIGGFYAYEHKTEIKKLEGGCKGNTDEHGLYICTKPPSVAGEVIVEARSSDANGLVSMTHRSFWLYEKDDWWFEVSDNDRIDILADKKQYQIGDTAKLQVRMPFRQATVLVTTEREGILEAHTQSLKGSEPIIEVPIKPEHSPNVFVSAFLVRGRTGDPKPTALVDMGRPAFKLGIAELKVGWKVHELKVQVSPEKKVYRVREKAKVSFSVKTHTGKPAPKGTEIAVAAVDSGLLELKPNTTWNLLEAMMNPRGLEVTTATAQMQVVGKRHFGLKALTSGGGGGRSSSRELFDTLLLWKGRLKLDENGQANIEIPLNDSVTSFKIVAIANSSLGEFGTGESEIRSTQELVIYSGLPQLMREGDHFRAEFTLRNGTDKPLSVDTQLSTEPNVENFSTQTLQLAPGESKEVGWKVLIPVGIQKIRYEAKATVNGTRLSDRISITQKVIPTTPIRTFQATISQLEKELSLPVQKPHDAIEGRGGIEVALQPSLLAGFGGIREYMSLYPYSCLEQLISKAIANRDVLLWEKLMLRLPQYLDGQGLLKFFPEMPFGYDILTSYVLSISQEAGWEIPESSRERMIRGLTQFVEGKTQNWYPYPAADWAIRKMTAIEALSRYNASKAVWLESLEIQPQLWPTSGVIDYLFVLRRHADIPERERKEAEAWQILKSRLNFQGTALTFSTETKDRLWWLMTTSDVNASRLVLAAIEALDNKRLPPPKALDAKADMPRLIRGALSRLKHGHWDLTLANAWGILALEKFAKTFEKTPVTGKTTSQLEGKSETLDWTKYEIKEQGTVKDSANTGLARQKALQTHFQFPWPQTGKGEKAGNLKLSHMGTGKPWVLFQAKAAIPLKKALSTGYKIEKRIKAIEQRKSGRWTKGDIVRVSLNLEAQTDMTWVVVDDPVPAGSTILGSGLGRDSSLAVKSEKNSKGVWPAFEERSFEAFRSYFEFVPKGKWSIEYTLRLNQSGKMNLPTTRVEAMYAPEMFGELPNDVQEILE